MRPRIARAAMITTRRVTCPRAGSGGVVVTESRYRTIRISGTRECRADALVAPGAARADSRPPSAVRAVA
jgi:hypothetical protein